MNFSYVHTQLECWLMWAVLVLSLIVIAQRWQVQDLRMARETHEEVAEEAAGEAEPEETDWPGMYGH